MTYSRAPWSFVLSHELAAQRLTNGEGTEFQKEVALFGQRNEDDQG